MGRMKMAFVLNFSFAIIELIGGLWTNSVAIMSDALHDFGDSLALLVAIVLEKISGKQGDQSFSYGYRRFSTMGALFTGLILVGGSVFILVEAIPRLFEPTQPHAEGMILLALLGVVVNGLAAYRVSGGTSLNERMLMWHMIEDVMGWVLVLIGAIVMKFWDLPQLDAGLAIVLALWILYNVFRNLNETMRVFLMATPRGFTPDSVKAKMREITGVQEIHHLHMWSLDGEKHLLTSHVVVASGTSWEASQVIKQNLKQALKELGFFEVTLEVEIEGAHCEDPDHHN